MSGIAEDSRTGVGKGDGVIVPTFDERHRAPVLVVPRIPSFDLAERRRYVIQEEPSEVRLPLDVLLVPRPGASVLVVSLHGYTDRKKYSLPRFERLASLSTLDTHVLYVSDPTLSLAADLSLAWYVGTASDDLVSRHAALIAACAAQLGVERVVLAGSSGGGYAALALGPRIPDSFVVAFSPQTRIGNYHAPHVNRFIRRVFPQFASWQEVEREYPRRMNLCLDASTNGGPKGWYVQNNRDPFHRKNHMAPYQKTVGPGMRFFEERHREGHGPPKVERVLDWVSAAIRHPDSPPAA
ncbi:hypothetical protein [Georgenia sp. AZ-5]|uniref:hypothetical protein n=1 Tax=Georgenia sp. AZ-5 TaxID=3367526 RepID=UPI003754EC3D